MFDKFFHSHNIDYVINVIQPLLAIFTYLAYRDPIFVSPKGGIIIASNILKASKIGKL